ncbi:ogr/Delta-like zinc finger family protein [Achromobacter xylosoxidans]
MNRFGMACPYCEAWATVRTSEQLSPLVRAAYFQCRNLHCGFTWKAHIEAVAAISPSALSQARPDIQLPLSPFRTSLRLAAAAKSDPRQMSLDHDE